MALSPKQFKLVLLKQLAEGELTLCQADSGEVRAVPGQTPLPPGFRCLNAEEAVAAIDTYLAKQGATYGHKH